MELDRESKEAESEKDGEESQELWEGKEMHKHRGHLLEQSTSPKDFVLTSGMADLQGDKGVDNRVVKKMYFIEADECIDDDVNPENLHENEDAASEKRQNKKQDRLNSRSEMDTTPIASTPRPRISLSTSGTTDREVYEPHSVYSRRQTAQKRKRKGKENIGASSCPPALKIQNTWNISKENGQNSLCKKTKAPCKKKQRAVLAEKDFLKYTYPQDFIERQRAYFAEVDEFELPVEEVEV